MLNRFSFLFAILLHGALVLSADILYSVTSLPIPPGDSRVNVTGLNNAGQVVGYVYTPSTFPHAFLYSNGLFTDLQSLFPGEVGSAASGINNSGQILIGSYIYSNGQLTNIGPLSGSAINDAGQVTGNFYPPSGGIYHAFLYTNGQVKDLGTVAGNFVGNISAGYAINNAGQVTGDTFDGSTLLFPTHAFLYANGQMLDLGTLGGDQSYGRAINNSGQVAGFSTLVGSDTPVHAFLYSNGQMTDLGTLGGPSSEAEGINDAGQIVGKFSVSASNFITHAFLDTHGEMQDLNNLIDPSLGITLGNAVAINDNGQIVATSAVNTVGAYLLTPISATPEPGTFALFGVALLGLGASAFRRSNDGTTTTKHHRSGAGVEPSTPPYLP